jgi:hypothetical protein
MKSILLFLVASSLVAPALAEQHLIASATLKTPKETVSTPKMELYLGVESVGRAGVRIGDRKYTFALKSSAYEQQGKYKYAVALSLSDTGKDDFVVSKAGETSSLEPMEFSLDVNGVHYSAVVNLVPK